MKTRSKPLVVNMTSPVGKPISSDKALKARVKKIRSDAPLEAYFRAVDDWEKEAIRKDREIELKVPSPPVGIFKTK